MDHPDRPLGRGLEEVSHLFLSQRTDQPGGEAASGWRPERPAPRQEPGSGAVLLRPATTVTREQLAAALKAMDGALENGLRVIDFEIPCAPCGEIDLLGIDRTNQLTIIDFELTASDDILARGLGHFDWMVANLPNVRRMFRGQAINFSLEPRLFLLAPQFSSRLRSAARQIQRPRIDWVRYTCVDVSGQTGILLDQPLTAD
ncbi:MAG TPA: hypothetical protein VH763_11585 [Gemmatimonadales bacterium]|jgi:hypothetical protein